MNLPFSGGLWIVVIVTKAVIVLIGRADTLQYLSSSGRGRGDYDIFRGFPGVPGEGAVPDPRVLAANSSAASFYLAAEIPEATTGFGRSVPAPYGPSTGNWTAVERGNPSKALEFGTGEYLLGYSSNPFGTHSAYIERVSDEIRQRQARHYSSYDVIGQGRRKRSVLHLYNMVLCATGCNPLSYKGYGCYCGFLGSGYVVDGIDRCCKIHDWCYDTTGCPMFLEYFIPYLWKCHHHHHLPVCVTDHSRLGAPGSCAQRLCECDRQLAQCLKMYPCPSRKALCTSSPWRLLQNLFMI